MSEVKELKLSTKIEIQQKEELKKMGIKKRREEVERRLQMSKTILAQSAKDIFQKILRPEPAWSPDKRKAEANKKRKELFNLFSTICVEVGIDLQQTTRSTSSINDLNRDNNDFADGLLAQMKFDKVGRFEIIGEDVVNYTFFEDLDEVDNTPRRLFKVNKKKVKYRHVVMDARIQPLSTSNVKFDRKAKWFASHILASPDLSPYFGVITGTLIETEEEIMRRWTEETELSKAFKIIRKKSGDAVANEEKKLEEDQMTMKELVKRFMETADPAICFGNDIVFYGWK